MENERNVPSIGQWILYIFVAGIPLIGFIMLIVWALDNYNVARKNWAAATLVLMIIGLIIVFLFWGVIIGAIVGSGLNS